MLRTSIFVCCENKRPTYEDKSPPSLTIFLTGGEVKCQISLCSSSRRSSRVVYFSRISSNYLRFSYGTMHHGGRHVFYPIDYFMNRPPVTDKKCNLWISISSYSNTGGIFKGTPSGSLHVKWITKVWNHLEFFWVEIWKFVSKILSLVRLLWDIVDGIAASTHSEHMHF